MKPILFAIAGSLMISAVAIAQPDPTRPVDPEAPPTPPPSPGDEPGDPPPPPPPPVVTHHDEDAPAPEPAARPSRPEGYSVGLGLGYRMPTELNLPNVSSARFRLASGLTFEPILSLGQLTSADDDGTLTMEDSTTEVEVALNVRVPFHSHGRVDFSLTGGIGYGVITSNPDGPSNDQTTSAFVLTYGLALDYWITQHWNLSMSTGNPLLVRTSSRRETGPGNPEVELTQSLFGLFFDPRVTVMLHLHL